jgi:sodium-dependent dicarboxylate transporter 2/3/5
MMPVGTPPNAMVYATGLVPHTAMMRVGLALNLLAIVLITVMASWML